MRNKRQPRAKSRDRKRPLKVVVNEDERLAIADKAASTGLSVSAYLREVGMGYQPKSNFDQEAIMTLMSLNADQGRLVGLLKLWLSEKPGQGCLVKSL